MYKIKKIDWKQTVPIRHRVLWPDKPPEFCYLEGDEHAIHFGAFVNQAIVCVASVYVNGKEARLRKYATEHAYQGQGIGSAVLAEIMVYLKTHKIDYFWCDARESALSFYKRFDMQRCGHRFYKNEIPYVKMGIHLN